MTRTPLVLPAVLAVTTFVAQPACVNDPVTEETGADGAETAGDDCFAIADMTACEADSTCRWDPDIEQCVLDCGIHEDQAACMAAQICAWDSVEGCLGPFT